MFERGDNSTNLFHVESVLFSALIGQGFTWDLSVEGETHSIKPCKSALNPRQNPAI